ncbi:MAG: lipopolysaccharide transport periplasmic protein LptA [Gammaproteobacteria bacterium]|nr:lipopolysaccharide transport periplasmic protein LptA [Gammaproteobacteria bacterium]
MSTSIVAKSVGDDLLITAKELEYDERNKVSLFKGQVSIKKNNFEMLGEKLLLTQRENGYYAVLTAENQPVKFTKLNDSTLETIKGQAFKLEYDSIKNQVLLLGNAEITINKGATGMQDQLKGENAVYNLDSGIFNITGANDKSLGTNSNVKVLISPRTK